MVLKISKISECSKTQLFQMMSCICFEVLLKASFQDTSKKHNLYSECFHNKAVISDCHLKEFSFRSICIIRVQKEKISVNIRAFCVSYKLENYPFRWF